MSFSLREHLTLQSRFPAWPLSSIVGFETDVNGYVRYARRGETLEAVTQSACVRFSVAMTYTVATVALHGKVWMPT